MSGHAARVIFHAERGWAHRPNSELLEGDRLELRQYVARAERALAAVQCRLVGASCTCWTLADLIAAARAQAGP